ncbi:hypothetical protein OB962_17905 [Aeromonas piscicola]|uniref:Uncharacterized protein n=1 Tax=Aeromonas piscicola TaxID=600645 RepID=A0ABT7QFW0_9GAMM|nr:hypothetical protein [Aeromonas piscicola]MDM5132852.1 hypothetical protein [Aeromonas piscicola]
MRQKKTNYELEQYLIGEYAFSSAKNDLKIEERSKNSKENIRWAFLSLAEMALSAITFITNDMDASSPRKSVDIIIKDIQIPSNGGISIQNNQNGVNTSCLDIIREIYHQETIHQKNHLHSQHQLLQVVDSQLTKTITGQKFK